MNNGKSTEDWEEEAEILEEQGDLLGALEHWRVAVKGEASAYNLCRFGSLSMELERWEDAKEAFQSAIDLSPELTHPYTQLGLLYLETSEPAKAQRYFEKSLTIERKARLFTLLGVAYLDQGLNTDARESFFKAVECDPSYEEAYLNLGVTFRDENAERAIEFFKRAIEIDPEYAVAHRECGWSLGGLKKVPEALYHLNRAIELNPRDGWAYIYLGNTLWADDDLSSAEQALKKAIDVWPEQSVGYWCLAYFYERQDRFEEAERLYERGIQLDPDDVEAHLRLALYLKQIGDQQKAKSCLARIISIDPNHRKARLAMAALE